MNHKSKFPVWIFPLILILSSFQSPSVQAADTVMAGTGKWESHASAEEAGWSTDKLEEARIYFDSLNSAAVFVVYKGKVLVEWGDASREYLTHSARKSFMSAMFGIYAAEGKIDLHKTLAELQIDDDPPLSEQEKSAQVIHLLKARSGVFHTAAAENQAMHDYKPERNTKKPDEHWAYNNWDFNTLVTIFNQETGEDFFEALAERIGKPLGMEEFGKDDGQYMLQKERSIHPAYHFRISARDAARFGQLFLQKGKWGKKQIVPEAWVAESTRRWSDGDGYIPGTGYGYMWWTFAKGYDNKKGIEHLCKFDSYAALGNGTQVILVIPELDWVYVHRVDTYIFQKKRVKIDAALKVADLILGARIVSVKEDTQIAPVKAEK